MHRQGAVSKLNLLEFHFLAMETTNLGALRFKERHGVEEIRQAVRYGLSIFPRLRTILEPTLCSYRLRVLDDADPRLATLFDDAFHVRHGMVYGSPEYFEYWTGIFNRAFALQKELPVSFHYLPDDDEPVLLMSFNHMLVDGVGSVFLVSIVLEYLNGKRHDVFPLDNPSLAPALLQTPLTKVPAQLYRSYKIFAAEARQARGEKIVPLSRRPVNFIAQNNAIYHMLTADLVTLKAKTKALDCTITVFLLTALVMAISRGPGRDKGDVVAVPVQVDLRHMFGDKPPLIGNFFSPPVVRVHRRHWEDPRAMIAAIKHQMHMRRAQIANREIIFPALLGKLNTLLGAKLYAWICRRQKGRLPVARSCIFSNPGSVDILNQDGARAQVRFIEAATMPDSVLVSAFSCDGRFRLGFCYPMAEFTRDEMQQFIQSYEQAVEELLQL